MSVGHQILVDNRFMHRLFDVDLKNFKWWIDILIQIRDVDQIEKVMWSAIWVALWWTIYWYFLFVYHGSSALYICQKLRHYLPPSKVVCFPFGAFVSLSERLYMLIFFDFHWDRSLKTCRLIHLPLGNIED